MTLKDWQQNGWVKPEPTSKREIEDLIKKAKRDMVECTNTDISLDWRLRMAYDASLGFATVALRAEGYRLPMGDGHHFRTIDSLRLTASIDQDLLIVLQAIRKKRNIISYDASGVTSEGEISEALEIAEELERKVIGWLRAKHPELL